MKRRTSKQDKTKESAIGTGTVGCDDSARRLCLANHGLRAAPAGCVGSAGAIVAGDPAMEQFIWIAVRVIREQWLEQAGK